MRPVVPTFPRAFPVLAEAMVAMRGQRSARWAGLAAGLLGLMLGSFVLAQQAARRGVAFVGFDTSPPLVQALGEGTIQGVVAHLKGETVEKRISTGETLVTPENRNDPELKAILNPPKLEHTANAASPKAKGKGKTLRLMVIPKGTTHEFWKTIHAGAAKAAADLGVTIVWKGPQKEDSRSEQIALVDNAVASGVDGIVLAPLDARALVPPVERAVAKGIPVVIIDSALESDRPASFVATDNYHGGELAGQRMGELLGGKGRIILLRYMVGSASTEERERGFLDTIQKKYPGITILEDKQHAGATSDTAQTVAQSLLTRFRGEVDGLFAPNESSTSGALRALRQAGLLQKRR
jgi:ribose transport system substrate-binding protein